MFSVDDLRAELAERGILRPCRFRVDMALPPALQQTDNELVKQANDGTISMWCEQASLPGVALEYYATRRYGYGATENKPFAPKFTDANMVFRSDGDGLVHSFLHTWMRTVLNYDHSGTIQQDGGSGQHTYELSYKDDYAQDITVTQFDDAGQPVLQVVLREAFPVYVGDVLLNWSSANEYSRVPATFTYIGWFSRPLSAA